MRQIFLVIAIVGTIVPYMFFYDFFANAPADASFLAALFVNGAAGGFSSDLLITSAAFWLLLLVLKTPYAWAYVLATLTIGLSCALPMFLYLNYHALADRFQRESDSA